MLTKTYTSTHIASRLTFIAELARKGSRKLRWSAMPARGRGGDELVDPRRVPLAVRRAAKAILRSPEVSESATFDVLVAVGRVLFIGISIAFIIASARAEPLPVPRPFSPGGSCPYGYVTSGSFCVPMQGAQDAIPKPPNGTCPFGWTSSGNSCPCSGSAQ
jgi:hypothetical protein